ncbi:MAG: hypothetical protein KGI38_01335 [Thaumarchaeota archaeon]|nr:hypothetical protein [Nitrososphaerota archaeon]
MTASEGLTNNSLPIRSMSGPMQSMEKMMPHFSDITFWLVANLVLFLYVGIFQLAYGYGPGRYLSAGAIVLAVIYQLLWMMRKTNKKMADQWIMIISGLAVLGDLVAVALVATGSFSGSSALLDIVGLMLFRATYKEYRGPM